jgi:transcriptional regulator with XRE-family HTH domain
MSEEIWKLIGERIRLAREQQGYTQAELGRRLELTEAEIQNIEQGEALLTLPTLLELGRTLNCSILQLLGIEAEEMTPDEAELIEMYRTLSPGLPRDYVITFLKSWVAHKKDAWGQSAKATGEETSKENNR